MSFKKSHMLYISNEIESYHFRYRDISVFHFTDFDMTVELTLTSGQEFGFQQENEQDYLKLKNTIIKHLAEEE